MLLQFIADKYVYKIAHCAISFTVIVLYFTITLLWQGYYMKYNVTI